MGKMLIQLNESSSCSLAVSLAKVVSNRNQRLALVCHATVLEQSLRHVRIWIEHCSCFPLLDQLPSKREIRTGIFAVEALVGDPLHHGWNVRARQYRQRQVVRLTSERNRTWEMDEKFTVGAVNRPAFGCSIQQRAHHLVGENT